MKKSVKIILSIIVILALVVGVQQGLKYYLKGPARNFNSIVVTGDKLDVENAKKIYKQDIKNAKDYYYKKISNQAETLDENGEPLKKDGVQVYHENVFMILSRTTAKQMLDDQMFRVRKDGDEMTGSIETIPMTEINGLNSKDNIYLSSPDAAKEIDINGQVLPLTYANYAWIGYYPETVGLPVILDDEIYNSIQSDEEQITLIELTLGKMDLRNESDKNSIKDKLSSITNIDIDYAYIK